MNPEFSKLRQREVQEQSQPSIQREQAQASQEQKFETVEELLRYDSAQNPVPPTVAEKLNDTLAQEPPPEQSWWQKLFGRK